MRHPLLYSFRISFRRLIKERRYALLNIAGLSVSMAAALLIFLYLLFETSYDKHHPNHEQIYRIALDASIGGKASRIAMNSVPLGPTLVENHPEFISFMRIFPANFFFRNIIYRYRDKGFQENHVFAADSTFFDFFGHEFIEGNRENALREPFTMVITESMAKRYFGNEPAYGKIIEAEGAGNFRVNGVVSDPRINSHMQFHGLFSISTLYHLDDLLSVSFMQGATWRGLHQNHNSRITWVYIKTVPGYDPDTFNRYYWESFYEDHIGDISFFDHIRLIFQPLADIHLTSKLAYEMTNETGAVTMMTPELVRIFFLIGIFLIIIASINYTNISISQFQNRGKEMGVKKVIGAQKHHLIIQFFSEALLISILSFILALFFLEILLPYINDFMGIKLTLNVFENKWLLLLFAGIAISTGFISGTYPAIYYTRFSPLFILTNRIQQGKGSLGLKKSLIVVQFMISVFMIIATMVVNAQLNFINNKNLGFDPANVIIIELKDHTSRNSVSALKEKFLENRYITNATRSNYFPSRITYTNSVTVETPHGVLNTITNLAQLGNDYAGFMGMKMAEGRFFDENSPYDFYQSVVINQAAKRHFGWTEATGQYVETVLNWPDGTQGGKRRVVGVVEDFHFTSVKQTILPLIIYPMTSEAQYLQLKLNPENIQYALAHTAAVWDELRPGYPLIYYWLDDIIGLMYTSQHILSSFFTIFALLCIFIAFLGIYGLSAYSIEQRTREIAVRKVLGANNAGIFLTLGKEFFLLILIACILASFFAWYFMSIWLSGFAFHTNIAYSSFIAGIVSAYSIASLAIIVHALKAIRLNPSVALKYE